MTYENSQNQNVDTDPDANVSLLPLLAAFLATILVAMIATSAIGIVSPLPLIAATVFSFLMMTVCRVFFETRNQRDVFIWVWFLLAFVSFLLVLFLTPGLLEDLSLGGGLEDVVARQNAR